MQKYEACQEKRELRRGKLGEEDTVKGKDDKRLKRRGGYRGGREDGRRELGGSGATETNVPELLELREHKLQTLKEIVFYKPSKANDSKAMKSLIITEY